MYLYKNILSQIIFQTNKYIFKIYFYSNTSVITKNKNWSQLLYFIYAFIFNILKLLIKPSTMCNIYEQMVAGQLTQ